MAADPEKRRRRWRIAGVVVGSCLALIGGMVGYAALTANSRMMFPDAPKPDLAASKDPAVIERGRYLVHGPAHCVECHSTDDREHPELVGTVPLQGGLAFAMGPLGTRYARNLTPDMETGIGKQTDAELARVLRSGVMADGELSFFMMLAAPNLADEDIVAVISYLRSLEPVKHEVPRGEWYLFGKILLTYAFPKMSPRDIKPAPYVAPAETPSVERGKYLSESVMLCTSCHTEFDMGTFQYGSKKAGGSLPDPSHGNDHEMEFVAPNLTSHPTGVTGRMSEDDFVKRIYLGRGYPSSIMPWEAFKNTTEADLRSVYRYLASLPPIDNDVGPTYRKQGSHKKP